MTVAIGGEPIKTFECAPLEQNGLKKMRLNFKVPETLSTGDNKITMTVSVNGKTVSYNEYPVYILNAKDIPLPGKERTPLVLLGQNFSMEKVLNGLKIPFTFTDGMPKQNEIAVFTAASSRKQTEQLVDWVMKGGKALVLEPANIPFGMSGHFEESPYNLASEMTLPDHPVFRGLGHQNFMFWNGTKARELFQQGIYPMNESVLMFRNGNNNHTFMTMGEMKMGKGRILFCQLKLQSLFGKDSCATKTMRNLIDYATTGFNDPRAPQIEPVKTHTITTFDVKGMVPTYIDLTKVVNMGLTDKVAGDKKGGWSDQGGWNNDGSCIKPGEVVAAGVPFRIIDEKKNNGKACIVLKGGPKTGMDFVPAASKPIVLMKHAKRLYFLVTSKWTPNKKEFGHIEITKALSTGVGTVQKERIALVGNVNIGDWWHSTGGSAVSGLTFSNGMGGKYSTYVIEWVDPEPENVVAEIRFISDAKSGYPIILAVTAMNDPKGKGNKK